MKQKDINGTNRVVKIVVLTLAFIGFGTVSNKIHEVVKRISDISKGRREYVNKHAEENRK